MNRKLKYLFILIICLFALTACKKDVEPATSYQLEDFPKDESATEEHLEPDLEPVINETKRVSLNVVGDIMFHEYQLTRAYDKDTESFSFDASFQYVKDSLSRADFTIGNLETTFAGKNGARNFSVDKWVQGYSGYPCFNTPDSAASAISLAGFDLLTTANNHSLDSGLEGLYRTLDLLDQNDILHVGTYRTKEEADEIEIVSINGIDFAFVSFTYAMNGFSAPEETPYIINSLDMYLPEKEELMCELVKKATEYHPDFVVVMPHFGNEYVEYPNSYQENLVDALFEAGADIILGSHPHVLQPIEVREEGFVIYSLGNFLSSQKRDSSGHKDLGVILNLEIEKVGLEKAVINGISIIPTYTYWTPEVIGILPVYETIERVEKGEMSLPSYDMERLYFARDYSSSHLTRYLESYDAKLEDYSYKVNFKKIY